MRKLIPALLFLAALGAAAADRLSEKVTLELKDADVRDTLEKVAVLLDAKAVVEPGIAGVVTLSAKDTPMGDVLKLLEKEAGLKITFEESDKGRVLHAARAAGAPSAARPAPEVQKFVFRSNGGVRVFTELGPWLLPVRLPDCVIPIEAALLRPDDGGRVVWPDGGGRARIVTPGSPPVRMPGCEDQFAVERARDDAPAKKAVKPEVVGPRFATRVRLLEIGKRGEEVLADPKVQSILGQGFTVRSGSTRGREIDLRGLVVEGTDTDAVLALSLIVDGESEPGKGVVRLAQADQTILLTLGRPERLLLAASFGPAKSQLLAELTVSAVERRSK